MRPHLNHFSKPPRPPVLGDIGRQLRELPSEAAPPYDFAEFRRRGRERSASKRQMVTWPYAAAAAGLTAFVAAMAMLATGDGRKPGLDGSKAHGVAAAVASGGAETPEGARSSAHVAAVAPENAASGAAGSTDLDPAEQARVAREWLARQPAEPALVRAGPRLAVASLEDRIAWFDDALTDQRLHGASAAQLQVLQLERARLVSSLAQVRYAESLVADGS